MQTQCDRRYSRAPPPSSTTDGNTHLLAGQMCLHARTGPAPSSDSLKGGVRPQCISSCISGGGHQELPGHACTKYSQKLLQCQGARKHKNNAHILGDRIRVHAQPGRNWSQPIWPASAPRRSYERVLAHASKASDVSVHCSASSEAPVLRRLEQADRVAGKRTGKTPQCRCTRPCRSRRPPPRAAASSRTPSCTAATCPCGARRTSP